MTPRRVLVAGTSGSGKSTLARRIAAASDLPYQEIDALRHGPGWQPRASFLDDVDAFTRQPEWVIEWQYSEVATRHPSLEVVRIAGPREAERWLEAGQAVVGASTAPPKRRLRDA
ncbi:hypothetical protein SAMN05428970_2422 [Agromyces sp. CF514]|uniref:hypothetical protein n=1 Tax=Agromyces sp. CF514 TaxID=1881031 RepID=UPI0008F07B00|nr:hypothetical protein [Agromyces sp. CF514]SFR78699.1 hypothetical protein SAMN05428970_2422 [Agromyces sp. CF514]